ncbi:band 7 protein AAEL010189-like [Mizuhopecten yessoensis]|uniref:band 7 protein AAEL010189-like n=1 Tax=Mizuhopecten yessoensis TaxID=6573 RepID=UPI000B458D09|nr:band 7 protein AAEL010189-like [Mizuhopecten yessoensis]
MDSNNSANEKTIGDGAIGCCGFVLLFFSCIIFLATLPFSLCASIHVVQEYERGVVFRLGRAVRGGARGPGIIFTLPCAEKFTLVDLRIKSFDIPPQEVSQPPTPTPQIGCALFVPSFEANT